MPQPSTNAKGALFLLVKKEMKLLLIMLLATASLTSQNTNLPTPKYSQMDVRFTGTATPLKVGSSDNILSEEDLLAAISWSTEVETVEFTHNSYNQTKAVGVYAYQVKATAGEKVVTVTNTVEVFDNTSPVVKARTLTIKSNATPLTDVKLKAAFTITDNYSTDLSIEIIENNYNQTTDVGTYTYKVLISDTAGNECVASNKVVVIDGTAPKIEGPDKITTGHKLSKKEIYSIFKVYDNVDQDLTLAYKYNEKENKLELSSVDSAGNKVMKTVEVEMIEDNSKFLFINGSVYIPATYTLSESDLYHLVKYYNPTATEEDVVSMQSTYYDTPNVPGEYDATLTINEKYYSFNIVLYEEAEVKEEGSKKNIFQKIGDFFKWLWKKTIGRLFD